MTESRIKILFLAANPLEMPRLRLDKQIRVIDEKLRLSELRDKFELRQYWAVRVGDLQGYLLRHQPDIVHFSGHGSQSSGIILEDDSGKHHLVSARALSTLFSLLKDNIRCVVLNTSYTEPQAEAIAEHIECVIGMSNAIGDSAAISLVQASLDCRILPSELTNSIGCGLSLSTAPTRAGASAETPIWMKPSSAEAVPAILGKGASAIAIALGSSRPMPMA